MPRPIVHIVITTDSHFVIPCLTMLTSAKANMDQESHYHIHVVYRSIEDYIKKAFLDLRAPNYHISLIEVQNDRWERFPKVGEFPPIVMLRLELPNILHNIDRVLFIDGDVIVLNDLTELYQTQMGDNLVAAMLSYSLEASGYAKQFRTGQCINAGIMLMNLKKLRNEDYVSKFFDAKLSAPKTWQYQDQDVINHCCTGRIKYLPPRYNVLIKIFRQYFQGDIESFNKYYGTNYSSMQALESDAVIIHLAGTHHFRPWERANGVYGPQWWHYYLMTPLAHLELPVITPDIRIQEEKQNIKRLEQRVRALENISNIHSREDHVPSSCVLQYKLFYFFPMLSTYTTYNSETGSVRKIIKLFNVFPVMVGKGNSNKMHWRLFMVLPIISWKRK